MCQALPVLEFLGVTPLYVPALAATLGIDAVMVDEDVVFIDAGLSPCRLRRVVDQVLADVAELASVAYCATA